MRLKYVDLYRTSFPVSLNRYIYSDVMPLKDPWMEEMQGISVLPSFCLRVKSCTFSSQVAAEMPLQQAFLKMRSMRLLLRSTPVHLASRSPQGSKSKVR